MPKKKAFGHRALDGGGVHRHERRQRPVGERGPQLSSHHFLARSGLAMDHHVRGAGLDPLDDPSQAVYRWALADHHVLPLLLAHFRSLLITAPGERAPLLHPRKHMEQLARVGILGDVIHGSQAHGLADRLEVRTAAAHHDRHVRVLLADPRDSQDAFVAAADLDVHQEDIDRAFLEQQDRLVGVMGRAALVPALERVLDSHVEIGIVITYKQLRQTVHREISRDGPGYNIQASLPGYGALGEAPGIQV